MDYDYEYDYGDEDIPEVDLPQDSDLTVFLDELDMDDDSYFEDEE
jgi:hypothetical protein